MDGLTTAIRDGDRVRMGTPILDAYASCHGRMVVPLSHPFRLHTYAVVHTYAVTESRGVGFDLWPGQRPDPSFHARAHRLESTLITADLDTVTQERDDLLSAPTSVTRARRLMASMPARECEQCHRSHPPFPTYWPGGFHGQPGTCVVCKPESDYQDQA